MIPRWFCCCFRCCLPVRLAFLCRRSFVIKSNGTKELLIASYYYTRRGVGWNSATIPFSSSVSTALQGVATRPRGVATGPWGVLWGSSSTTLRDLWNRKLSNKSNSRGYVAIMVNATNVAFIHFRISVLTTKITRPMIKQLKGNNMQYIDSNYEQRQ